MSTPMVLLEVAKRYHRDGRLDEAEAAYRSVLAAEPNNGAAWHMLGLLLQSRNRRGEAIEAIRTAVAAEPGNGAHHLMLAKLLVANGDPKGAAASYEEAIRLAPSDGAAWLGLGFVRHEQGDMAAAVSAYERAFALIEPNPALQEMLLQNARRGLFFGVGSGLQGAHAPERQVFISAAASLLRDRAAPIRILEIGSYLGASALTWARAIDVLAGKAAAILCVDTWTGGHLDAQFLKSDAALADEMARYLAASDTAYRVFLNNVATAPKSIVITARRGSSAEIVPQLEPDSFDLVYIDGSHRYDEVAADIRNADRVLRNGGFMCGDDLELQADDCDIENARHHRQDDFIVDPRTGRSFHPGVAVAVGERLGRVSAYSGFWIVQKTADGYRPVDLRDAEGLLPLHWPAAVIAELRARFATSGELRRVRD